MVKAGVDEFTQTVVAPPDMVATFGKALIINEIPAALEQYPSFTVYKTLTDPGAVPVTIPPKETLAVPVPLFIVHSPPDILFVNAGVVAFTQIEAAPPPTDPTKGKGLIINDFVTAFVQVPLK